MYIEQLDSDQRHEQIEIRGGNRKIDPIQIVIKLMKMKSFLYGFYG